MKIRYMMLVVNDEALVNRLALIPFRTFGSPFKGLLFYT